MSTTTYVFVENEEKNRHFSVEENTLSVVMPPTIKGCELGTDFIQFDETSILINGDITIKIE